MNLQLPEHLSQLLFRHECVVLPGLGAFLTRYHSAEANTATGMLRPPSRRVHFNASIKENDGLLANSVSRSQNISYKKAMQFIQDQLNEWLSQIDGGEKINLTGVGRLFKDDNGNLQFSPSLENNFLTSSYGLSIFRMPPLQREAEIRKTIHKAIEKHVPISKNEPREKRRKFAWAAVLIPLAFAGVVGAGYYAYENSDWENQAGFDWWKKSPQTTVDSPQPAGDGKRDALMSDEKLPAGNSDDLEISNNKRETRNLPPSGKPETPKTDLGTKNKGLEKSAQTVVEVPATHNPQLTTSSSGFHIVVGSFKEKGNAESYILQLRSQGFDAYLAEGNARFNRVAIGNFSSRQAANQDLNSIRANVNSGAWVFAN